MTVLAELAALEGLTEAPSVTSTSGGRQVTVRVEGATFSAFGDTVDDAAGAVLELIHEAGIDAKAAEPAKPEG